MGALERYRVNNGYTYRKLSMSLGVSLAMVHRICKGNADKVNLATALKIAAATQIKIEELI